MLLWNKFTWFFHFSRNILFAIIHCPSHPHLDSMYGIYLQYLLISLICSCFALYVQSVIIDESAWKMTKKDTNMWQHVKLTRRMLYNIPLEWKCLPSEYIHCVWILHKYGINYYQKLNFEFINKHNIPSSGMNRKICHAKLNAEDTQWNWVPNSTLRNVKRERARRAKVVVKVARSGFHFSEYWISTFGYFTWRLLFYCCSLEYCST